MEARHAHLGRLLPRSPIPFPDPIGILGSRVEIASPNHVVDRRSAATTTTSASTETGIGSSTYTLPIVLGVVIPVVGAGLVFLILHRRYLRKQREEDANEHHRSLDFGMGDVRPGRKKRGIAGLSMSGEKSRRGQHQVSMDMALNSPYLLPPELQDSRESLHSLSRTIHQNEDPYRPIAQLHDGASIRSYSRGPDGSSIYTGKSNPYSHAPSKFQESSTADLISNASKMSRSNSPMTTFVPPPRQTSLQSKSPFANSMDAQSEDAPPPPPPYPVEPPQAHMPEPSIARKGLPASPLPAARLAPASSANNEGVESSPSGVDASLRHSDNYLGAFINADDLNKAGDRAAERELPLIPNRQSPPIGLPSNPRPAHDGYTSTAQLPDQTFMQDENDYGDSFKITPPSPGLEKAHHVREHRYSMDVPPEEFAHAGLGAPGFDARRLSMGFRPLPPDAVTEVDDPEIRANRIRSFYREYFDESKPAPQGQYYEDYDENYLGDAAYYDADSNNFVMPYAQPVTRRAMTPPPRGPRFQGPPRGMHSSMGGMGPNGFRGAPGPRAYSSASGRMAAPRRPMPPPAALPTLPTPSKLRDDSFALFNAMDFAPPASYRDRAAGRSESPLGERRPYSPAVPAFVPTASAFEELAPMPSPHLLRKSGTFTGLDFAPPRRFKDSDTMSDAGSIRSNRSGVSAMQLGAIRNGAYRVSRLPQDMVGTKDDLSASLRPQWGMRVGS